MPVSHDSVLEYPGTVCRRPPVGDTCVGASWFMVHPLKIGRGNKDHHYDASRARGHLTLREFVRGRMTGRHLHTIHAFHLAVEMVAMPMLIGGSSCD